MNVLCVSLDNRYTWNWSITSPFRSSHLLPVKLRGRTVLVENVTSVPPRNKVGAAFQLLGLYKQWLHKLNLVMSPAVTCWLQAAMWVLGTKPRSSVRATDTLNCWASSLVPFLMLWFLSGWFFSYLTKISLKPFSLYLSFLLNYNSSIFHVKRH